MIEYVLLSIFFSQWNRHRGGGSPRINLFLENKINFSLGRSLWTGSLILFLILVPFFHFKAISEPVFLSTGIIIGLILLMLNGWGSYYHMGSNKQMYKSEPEVAWIDTILYFLFGPMYIPNKEQDKEQYIRDKWSWSIKELFVLPLSLGFRPPDVVVSEQKRSDRWLILRSFTGMCLRGVHSIFLFGFLAYFCDNIFLLWFVPIFSILFGLSYLLWYNPYVKIKWPYKDSIELKNKYLSLSFGVHSMAERTVGLLIGICIVVATYLIHENI